eukprot:gene2818-4226_t
MKNQTKQEIRLPKEILIYSFDFLDTKDKIYLRLVSKEFKHIVNDGITTIKLVDWSFTFFEKNLIERISRFKYLKNLKIEKSKSLDDKKFEEVISNLKSNRTIKTLKINTCESLIDPKLKFNFLEEISIQNCRNLKSLNLINDQQPDNNIIKKLEFGYKSVFNCQNLEIVTFKKKLKIEYLDLSSSKFDDSNLEKLIQYSNETLQELYLISCLCLKNPVIKNLKNLRVLNLSKTNINDEFINENLNFLYNLKELNLTHCEKLINPEIENFNLEMLKMGWNDNLKNPNIKCFNLKTLHVNFCHQLKLPRVESNHLEYIDFSKSSISSSSLSNILNSNPNLNRLNIKACLNLSKLNLFHDKLNEITFSNGPNLNEINLNLPEMMLFITSGTKMTEEMRNKIREGTNTKMRFIY